MAETTVAPTNVKVKFTTKPTRERPAASAGGAQKRFADLQRRGLISERQAARLETKGMRNG